METTARQHQHQTLHAVVYPVCVCGHSYPEHLAGKACLGYLPSRPIEDHGCISDKVVEV